MYLESQYFVIFMNDMLNMRELINIITTIDYRISGKILENMRTMVAIYVQLNIPTFRALPKVNDSIRKHLNVTMITMKVSMAML